MKIFLIGLLLILCCNAEIHYTEYQRDVILSMTDYPLTAKLFMDSNEWKNVSLFCFNENKKDFKHETIPVIYHILKDVKNSSFEIRKVVHLALEILTDRFDKAGVYKFDSIVFRHAEEIPFMIIYKCDTTQNILDLQVSNGRSIVMDHQKIIDVISLKENFNQESFITENLMKTIRLGLFCGFVISIILYIYVRYGQSRRPRRNVD